ncbi:unnamed protein product [Somion occarium]|uniref:AB hydrolase-1 domain-containing protein n=1 Tax=Somion occarium TaxID=3059160 RepID=A0ABP1DYL1_9APHY
MPTAQVNEEGAVLFYEDSGPPADSTTYTTVVLIHGLIFHGAVFRRLLPHAVPKNLRLVSVNLRDYPGSSPYAQSELDAFRSANENVQTEAITNLEKQRNEDGTVSGGLALITWSMSNILSLSFLAHADTLPHATKSLLDKYLRTIVLHDASIATLGVNPYIAATSLGSSSTVLYSPLRDQSLPFPERVKRFSTWVSSYYTKVDDLATLTPDLIISREPIQGAGKIPTVQRMSPEEIRATTDFGVLERSHDSIRLVNSRIYSRNLRRALGVGMEGEDIPWPKVKVLALWCDTGIVDTVWAAKAIYDLLHGEEGVTREVALQKLEGANHFVHWDEPELFVEAVSRHI